MRNSTALRRLSFAIKERATEAVIFFITDPGTGIPEFLGVGLIGYIFEHTGNFSVFNFIEQLAAKLKIVPLLVNRERAITNNVDTFLYIFIISFTESGVLPGASDTLGIR
jgi:hypothetical protein